MLLKSVICGLVYLLCSLLIIVVVYIIDIDSFDLTFILGIIYGIFLAVFMDYNNVKRTVIARVVGILSAVVAQVILFITGIPYAIIQYIYRNDEFVREMGYLTVNEVIGYNFGLVYFWVVALIAFVVSVISIFILNVIRNRKK